MSDVWDVGDRIVDVVCAVCGYLTPAGERERERERERENIRSTRVYVSLGYVVDSFYVLYKKYY